MAVIALEAFQLSLLVGQNFLNSIVKGLDLLVSQIAIVAADFVPFGSVLNHLGLDDKLTLVLVFVGLVLSLLGGFGGVFLPGCLQICL